MPTLPELKALAKESNIREYYKMSKADLMEELIKNGKLAKRATTDIEIMANDEYEGKGRKIFKKICQKESTVKGKKVFVSILAHDDDVLFVKGETSGKGVGKGGPSWHIQKKYM